MAGHQGKNRRLPKQSFRPYLEELESRLAPSANAVTSYQLKPSASPGSSPSGYTPLQILEGYGFYSASGTNAISFNGVAGTGAGQTIAIVDAYNDPNIASDLAAFDAQFHLQAPASFSVVNQNGQTTSLPGVDSTGGWEMEEALDVEWAHAIAPGASIVLVEANSSSDANLYAAVGTAANLPGVSVVSMSWSGGEYSGESSSDSVFTTPAGHQGVTFLAATGDNGSPSGYPAFSPNVVAVGGTSLSLNGNNSYQSESAWSGSGGGISTMEAEPSYQRSVQSTGMRTVPDVSFDADPNTGVAIYDSYDNSSGSWTQIGGTSLSTPAWAGIMALINQGRVAEGGTTLNGATQTLPALYSLSSSDFHDVTTGGNGTYSATTGYDYVTGLGTPIASNLVPAMVSYANQSVQHFVVTAAPPNSAAGSLFGFTVKDEIGTTVDTAFNGSVTVSLANNPGSSTLGGTVTVTAVNGVATFSGLSLGKVGTGYTLNVAATGVTGATTPAFNITVGAAAKIVATTQPPASVAQSTAFSVAFAVEDANGNVLTGDNTDGVTVSFANNAGAATLGGTTTVTVKNGVATFSNLTVNKAGSGYTLQAHTASFTSAPTNAFAVTAAATRVQVTVQPAASVTAGSSFSVTVSAVDANGNLVTNYSGSFTVSLASNTGGATLGGTLTAKAVNGQATFTNLTLNKPGSNYTLQFSGTGLSSATTNAFNVVVVGTRVVVTTQPSGSVGAGAPFGLTLAVEDSLGNVATGYVGSLTVSLAANPGGSTLGGSLAATVTKGIATFAGLSIDGSGTGYTLQVSGNGLTAATTSKFNVTAGAVTHLAIVTQPPSAVSVGGAFTVVVAAEDLYGNVVTGYTGQITLALANNVAGATLGGTSTVSVVNGLATFDNLTLGKSGTGYTLQASTTAASSLSAVTTSAFNVGLSATQLVFTTEPPATIQQGAAFTVAVSVEDAAGDVITGYTGSITIAIAGNPSGGSVMVSVVNGVATFSLSLTGTGSLSLLATASGLTSATTTPIALTAPQGYRHR